MRLWVATLAVWWRVLTGGSLNPLDGLDLGPDAVVWLPALVIVVIAVVMLLPMLGQGRSAREEGGAIGFIEEIDAIGSRRGGLDGGGDGPISSGAAGSSTSCSSSSRASTPRRWGSAWPAG